MAVGLPERHEVEAAGLADELADGFGVGDARQLDDDAVAALGRDDRLGDAGRVHPALDDVLDDADVARRSATCRRPGAPGTRPAGRPAGRGRASSRSTRDAAVGVAESGSRQPGKKSMKRASDADEQDEDRDRLCASRRDATRKPRSARAVSGRRRPRASALGLERRLDPLRQRAADARHRGDLLDRRLADALDRAEDLEQLALALRARRPGRSSKAERTAALRAQVAVVGDREAVRLVAQALDEVQRRRRRRQDDRVRRGRAGTAPRAPWPGRPAAGRAGRARRGPPWRR